MTVFDEYTSRVKELVRSLEGTLSPEGIREAEDLVDHGEAPLGMVALAWAIVNEGIFVPADTIARLREYSAGFELPDFPPNLDHFTARD
jgi:hypothetical protein